MAEIAMDSFSKTSKPLIPDAPQNIKAPKTVEVYNTITTPIPELKFTPEQYANLGELLADNSRGLGDKIAKALGLNPRQLGEAFDKAISQTPEKPKGII